MNGLSILPNSNMDKVEMPNIQLVACNFKNPNNKYVKSMEAGLGRALVMGNNKIVPSSDFEGHRLQSNVQ